MRKNEKQQNIHSDSLISKSNELSLSRLNTGLTLQQMQLFFFAIYQTQKIGSTSFRKSEFEKFFSLIRYGTVAAKEDVSKLMDLKVATEDLANDEFAFWNVFSRISYKKGLFEFSWTPDMIPHILELKEKFVLLDLGVISKFTSNFSWRLYDFIKAKHGFWNIRISRDDLMTLFNVESNKAYQQNSSAFKKRVLNPATHEINTHTEYTIEYFEVKNGRKTVAYDLKWSKGKTIKVISAKQQDELELYIATIIGDMASVFELNSTKQQVALGILNEIHRFKIRVAKGLPEKEFTQLRKELKGKMAEYHALFE